MRSESASDNNNRRARAAARKTAHPSISDPFNVRSEFVDGPVNLSISGNHAILSFCQRRPAETAFDGMLAFESVLVARIVMPLPMVAELKKLLDRFATKTPPPGHA